MKPLHLAAFLLITAAVTYGAAESKPAAAAVLSGPLQWIEFPDTRLELRGLPWFKENAPDLWRLPKSAQAQVPKGVWARAVSPDGGRIRFTSTTSSLVLRVQVMQTQKKLAYFDAYIDAEFAGSAGSPGPKTADLVLFAGRDRAPKNITIYLPHTSQVRVLAVGVEDGAKVQPPPPFARPDPLVCYGSSVLQGTGAEHPSKTYPAVLARQLNLDFINLGFGGAGKAEPAVVALVNQPKASGYLFDLGKSYGNQEQAPFDKMLSDLRAAHPGVPMFVVTPIYSTNEPKDKAYFEKSVRLRDLMRNSALARTRSGDGGMVVIEGLDLFGPADQALFHDPQHPNDAGNELIGQRLLPIVRPRLLAK